VICYQRILYLISSADNVGADTHPGGGTDHTGFDVEATNTINNNPSEETVNRLQGYFLFDVLECYIDAILNLWQQAQDGAISILTATTGTLLVI
jgi:hypothetical protein